ncbi:MAG: DNA polymerase IV [Deltaproteobacteria bacterium]|nr:DNA polymerase IV [Deltaproteobacteria bacterium]
MAGDLPAAPAADSAGGQAAAKSPKAVIHLDLDAFYASVEVLDDPSLHGRPVVVGSPEPRGVVSTCSYEARAFGVRSAMPGPQAFRLCPHAAFRPPRMARYQELSRAVMDIFRRYTPLVEPLALDEAFLDVTGSQRLFGPAPELAERIRAEVRGETGLTISAGVAALKHVAKLACGLNKPDGLTVVPAGSEKEFLRDLPVSLLWGAGPAAQKVLAGLGVSRIGQLAALPISVLVGRLGESGRRMWHLANGEDFRDVEPQRTIKSLGAEETYAVDLGRPEEVARELLALSVKVGRRLREAGLKALTVHLKVRDARFQTVTRSKTLKKPLDDYRELRRIAWELFPAEKKGPWRLLGLTTSNLLAASDVFEPAELFDAGSLLAPGRLPGLEPATPPVAAPDPRPAKALDAVNRRFGEGGLKPAALLEAAGRLGGPSRPRAKPSGRTEVARRPEEDEDFSGWSDDD